MIEGSGWWYRSCFGFQRKTRRVWWTESIGDRGREMNNQFNRSTLLRLMKIGVRSETLMWCWNMKCWWMSNWLCLCRSKWWPRNDWWFECSKTLWATHISRWWSMIMSRIEDWSHRCLSYLCHERSNSNRLQMQETMRRICIKCEFYMKFSLSRRAREGEAEAEENK